MGLKFQELLENLCFAFQSRWDPPNRNFSILVKNTVRQVVKNPSRPLTIRRFCPQFEQGLSSIPYPCNVLVPIKSNDLTNGCDHNKADISPLKKFWDHSVQERKLLFLDEICESVWDSYLLGQHAIKMNEMEWFVINMIERSLNEIQLYRKSNILDKKNSKWANQLWTQNLWCPMSSGMLKKKKKNFRNIRRWR